MPKKTYVAVTHDTDETGFIRPLSLLFHGVPYQVDRVLDVRPAHADQVGGMGIRYHIRINNRHTYLFLDDHGRWFVEEKDGSAARPAPAIPETYRF